MEPLAELRQGLRHIGVGILCQINRPDLPGQYSLAQLLCPHQEPGSCQVRQIAGIRYSTYFFHIHTRLYYTQKFRIVNHFPKIILYKPRALPGTILTFRTTFLLLCVSQKQMFPGFLRPGGSLAYSSTGTGSRIRISSGVMSQSMARTSTPPAAASRRALAKAGSRSCWGRKLFTGRIWMTKST